MVMTVVYYSMPVVAWLALRSLKPTEVRLRHMEDELRGLKEGMADLERAPGCLDVSTPNRSLRESRLPRTGVD